MSLFFGLLEVAFFDFKDPFRSRLCVCQCFGEKRHSSSLPLRCLIIHLTKSLRLRDLSLGFLHSHFLDVAQNCLPSSSAFEKCMKLRNKRSGFALFPTFYEESLDHFDPPISIFNIRFPCFLFIMAHIWEPPVAPSSHVDRV